MSRSGPAGVSGARRVGVAFFDCATFRYSRLNVQSSISYLVSVLKEALEEEGGDLFGATLLELVAAGEGEEGVAGLGDGGEEGAELGELGRAAAVLQRIEVATWGTGAGPGAASAILGHRWTQMGHRLSLPIPWVGRR